jgi:hypothetical protein
VHNAAGVSVMPLRERTTLISLRPDPVPQALATEPPALRSRHPIRNP